MLETATSWKMVRAAQPTKVKLIENLFQSLDNINIFLFKSKNAVAPKLYSLIKLYKKLCD